MGYGAKRLAEIEAERKARKKEKERLKKEKEKEKEREKKRKKALKRKIKLKRLNSKRAYEKRRKARLELIKQTGDEHAYYTILVVKNNRKLRSVGRSWWKIKAYGIFNDAVEKNRQSVVFPRTVMTNRKNGQHDAQPLKYEILLVKKVNEGEDTTSSFRNEEGKFIDNVITDWPGHVIVEKAEWLVEETFGVYGHHPSRDRKTYTFILENLILSSDDTADEMRRVMVFKNKVIIQYIDDFDFITCYDNKQAKTLYDRLETDVSRLKRKYIVFMGEAAKDTSTKWLDKFEDKTGWNRISLMHKSTAN